MEKTKKEQVLERLQKRAEAAKQAKISRPVNEDKVIKHQQDDGFTEAFTPIHHRLLQMLEECPSKDPKELKDHFVSISRELARAQDLLEQSSPYLSSYRIRKAQVDISALKDSLQKSQDLYLPKPKFSFRSKLTINNKDTVDSSRIMPKPPPTEGSKPSENNKTSSSVPEHGFCDQQKKDLKMVAEEVNQKDIEITRLRGCNVTLQGSPGTVHLSHLRQCCVLMGPVSTSVFVEDCAGCTIVAACQQLRVHRTAASTFYLHVTSQAIIEDCKSLTFAPYNWTYPQLLTDVKKSGLNWNSDNWSKVQDFNWPLPNKPSPNWSVLEPSQRLTPEACKISLLSS